MKIFRSSLVASSPDSGLALMKKEVLSKCSIREEAIVVPTILEHFSVNLFSIICQTKSILANVSKYIMCTARITFMSLPTTSQAPCNHPHTSQSPELLRTVLQNSFMLSSRLPSHHTICHELHDPHRLLFSAPQPSTRLDRQFRISRPKPVLHSQCCLL